jgi:hypothetical protein
VGRCVGRIQSQAIRLMRCQTRIKRGCYSPASAASSEHLDRRAQSGGQNDRRRASSATVTPRATVRSAVLRLVPRVRSPRAGCSRKIALPVSRSPEEEAIHAFPKQVLAIGRVGRDADSHRLLEISA